jgi:hypothetical protein
MISFDVPYPADYGGVIDVFYTIKELHEANIGVILHCFEYGRGEQKELEKYCQEVHYYSRSTGHKGVSANLPYIVSSRTDESLLERLLLDEHPILLQGIHCTYLLNDPRFAGRKILTRLMNVEHEYYHHLGKTCSSLLKKMYYYRESRLLKKYEHAIADKTTFIAISETDAEYYRKELSAKHVVSIPAIHPYDEITSKEGIGCYCLYHGNLSVPENEKAAVWLAREVFNDLKVPLLVAGKNPSSKLQRILSDHSNICLVADPSEQEMQDMIQKAQINIIPSLNNTGLKLKLLNALFNGRHCVVNDAAVKGTHMQAACHIAGNAEGFKSIIIQLYHKPFSDDEIMLRKKLIQTQLASRKNVQQMIDLIWPVNSHEYKSAGQ